MKFKLKYFLITLVYYIFKILKVYKILLLFIIIFLLYIYIYGYGLKIVFFIITLLISLINKNNFYSFFSMIKNFIITNLLKNILFFWFLLNFDINSILIYLTNDISVDIDKEDQDKESKKRILIVIIFYTISLVLIYWFIQNGGGPQPSNFDINTTDISTNDKPPQFISILDDLERGYDSLQAREAWYAAHPDYVSSESSESSESNEVNLDDSNTYDYVDPVINAYADYEYDSTDESYKKDEE